MYFFKTTLFSMLLLNTCLAFAASGIHQDVLNKLHLPQGFTISVYADNVPNARSLALGDDGVVYIGTGSAGKVYAVQDNNKDGVADKHYVIASGLNMPNGVAYKDGA
ncbi:MAG: sorbosone dehydrogenase family protein, partial [Methylococcales bacterium]|nr:sorbosone dehydrogenase family protein [Methylococcales bacterium]